MSAIDKFLFTAGMEGFNDPSSIPSVGIVVPFFGVEEFAEADAEQAQRMTEMNQQANAIYKLQETLVYIDAHRPNFDRSNAEVVQQALGEVQVLMPTIEDPVTIMGSLEHYTPAYTNHLLSHGVESLTSKIWTAIKYILGLLKKSWSVLSKLIQAKNVIFGKQKRDIDELSQWLKTRKTSINTTVGLVVDNTVSSRVITVTAPQYLCVADPRGIPTYCKPDTLATSVRSYQSFLNSFANDFIGRHIELGRLMIRALDAADFNLPVAQLYVKVFKGAPSYNIGGPYTIVRGRRNESVVLESLGAIGGVGFTAQLNQNVVTPVGLTPDGSEQRRFFLAMRSINTYSFTSKIGFKYPLQNTPQLYACTEEEATQLTNSLDSLVSWMLSANFDTDVKDFNSEVSAAIEKLTKKTDTASGDITEFAILISTVLSDMAAALESLVYGMNSQTNALVNNVREYVTKSVKE